MTRSEQIDQLATALAKAQAAMTPALKDSANPFFKSSYADLAAVWAACRGPLTANGLSIVQSPSVDHFDGVPVVTVDTMLLHVSGQYLTGTVSAAPKDASPQAIGSVITYLRRYALQSFVGVAADDDDGEAAQGRGRASYQAAKPRPADEPSQAPDGYDEWLADMQAVADEGTDALRKAWMNSSEPFRMRLERGVGNDKWRELKAKAAAVTAAKVEKAKTEKVTR